MNLKSNVKVLRVCKEGIILMAKQYIRFMPSACLSRCAVGGENGYLERMVDALCIFFILFEGSGQESTQAFPRNPACFFFFFFFYRAVI